MGGSLLESVQHADLSEVRTTTSRKQDRAPLRGDRKTYTLPAWRRRRLRYWRS